MSDNSNLFDMLGNVGKGPGGCPPPCPPGGGSFGGNGIIIWVIILLFLCRGGFGNFGFGNNSASNCGCGNNSGNNWGGMGNAGFDTGCCTTMMPNPCDFTECCNCCGKKVKHCKKQKNYIVEMCQCGGNPAPANNCGCGNNGFGNGCGNNGFGNGFGSWWIIIIIIFFCFRGGRGFGGSPFFPGFPSSKDSCER